MKLSSLYRLFGLILVITPALGIYGYMKTGIQLSIGVLILLTAGSIGRKIRAKHTEPADSLSERASTVRRV